MQKLRTRSARAATAAVLGAVGLALATTGGLVGSAWGASTPDSALDGADQPAYSARAVRPALAALEARGLRDWDPLERVNRGLFSINGVLDRFVTEPAARGWKAVTAQGVRDSVGRLFANLQFPVRFVGCLTEGRLLASSQELGRFALNSTAGVVGLFDPAARLGLLPHYEDLGKSFGRWGLGPGPYLVLPLLGPTSLRDLIDLPLRSVGSLLPGLNLLGWVNTRAGLIEQVDQARAASLDLYVFARGAYLQSRRERVVDPVALLAPSPIPAGQERDSVQRGLSTVSGAAL